VYFWLPSCDTALVLVTSYDRYERYRCTCALNIVWHRAIDRISDTFDVILRLETFCLPTSDPPRWTSATHVAPLISTYVGFHSPAALLFRAFRHRRSDPLRFMRSRLWHAARKSGLISTNKRAWDWTYGVSLWSARWTIWPPDPLHAGDVNEWWWWIGLSRGWTFTYLHGLCLSFTHRSCTCDYARTHTSSR